MAGSGSIGIRRVYDPAPPREGARFLVDRIWPRGVRKDALEGVTWLRDAGPSDALRRWFGHDPARWEEFRRRYRAELEARPSAWVPILDAERRGPVTLLYGARDAEHNQAVVLRDFLESRRRAASALRSRIRSAPSRRPRPQEVRI